MSINVAIIGAGLGGLACAIALQRQGIDVRVYEQAKELRPVGGALALFPNGLNVLELIEPGIIEDIKKAGCCVQQIVRKNLAGEIISSNPTTQLVEKYGQTIVTIWWWRLQQVLASKLPKDVIHLNCQCIGFEQKDGEVEIHFAGGKIARADLLIGADGIGSAVRKTLIGDEPPRYLNSMAWRATIACQQDILNPDEIVRIVDDRQFLFLLNVGDGYINWTTRRFTPQYRFSTNSKEMKDRILQNLTNLTEPIRNLIEITTPEAIFESLICDRLPLDSWSKGKVTLLGDAAHPMSPSMGQGANSTFEDAWTIAQCLSQFSTIEAALNEYERERIERTKILQIKSAEAEKKQWQIDEEIQPEPKTINLDTNFRNWIHNYKPYSVRE